MVKDENDSSKLKAVYPIETPNSTLAENLLEWLESLPHAQRLYPDLFVNDLAKKVESFYEENLKPRG